MVVSPTGEKQVAMMMIHTRGRAASREWGGGKEAGGRVQAVWGGGPASECLLLHLLLSVLELGSACDTQQW